MFRKVVLTSWVEEQNKGRQIGWESFRCPSSEFRGQFSFGAKRFWSAMRPRIALKIEQAAKPVLSHSASPNERLTGSA
jgi:hypothetical protein